MQILSHLSPEHPIQYLKAFSQLRLSEKNRGKNIVCREQKSISGSGDLFQKLELCMRSIFK